MLLRYYCFGGTNCKVYVFFIHYSLTIKAVIEAFENLVNVGFRSSTIKDRQI